MNFCLCPSLFRVRAAFPLSRITAALRLFLAAALLSLALGSQEALAQTAHFTVAQSSIGSGLHQPQGIAVDANGAVYIADAINDRVVKEQLTVGGYVQTVIPSSALNNPRGVAVDASGNVYIVDTDNERLLKETLSGGSYSESVIPTSSLRYPEQIVVTATGNLYFVDEYNSRIVEEAVSGAGYKESVLVSRGLDYPTGIAVDASGTVYIADSGSNRILVARPSSNYSLSTLPANGLAGPQGVAVDANGVLYIADTKNNRVVIETPSGSGYVQTAIASTSYNQPFGLAVDAAGWIYLSNSADNQVLKLQTETADFGSISTGSPSGVLTFMFTFDTAGTLSGSPVVVTQGALGKDFVDARNGSCAASHTYNVADTCTVNVTFTPATAGVRYGAVMLQGAAGSVAVTGYVQGTGSGPQVAFAPGVQSIAASGLLNPRAIASDGNGNLYIADTGHNEILQETLSGGAYIQSVIATSSLANPMGVSIDGAGNLYVADTANGRILRESFVNGTTIETQILQSGLSQPEAISMDGAGSLYIADSGNGRIVKATAAAGAYSTSVVVSGLSAPQQAVVDAAGNLYVADSGNNRILKETLTGGAYVQSVIPTSTLHGPGCLAVDTNANLYIADKYNNRVLQETLVNGAYVESTIGSSLAETDCLALDAHGNLYIVDTGNNRVLKEDAADAPALSFAATPLGTTSNEQLISLQNIGNAPLSFPAPSSGSNPAISAPFTLDVGAAGSCPQEQAGQQPSVLPPNAACTLAVRFAPTSQGSLQGDLIVGDNHLNAPGAMQDLSLSGNGSAEQSTLTLSAPSTATYGNPVQVTASVSNNATGAPVSGGTINFADQNGSFGSVSLQAGVANRSYLASSIGTFTLSGAFTPSSNTISGSNAQTQIQITAAPLTVTANNLQRVYGTANPQFTGTIAGAVNGDSFTESFKTSASTGSPVAAYPIVPSASGANLSNYTQAIQNGNLQVTPAGLTVTANNVTRTYGVANPQFTGTVTGAVNGDSFAETFTTSATAASPVATYAIVPAVSGPSLSNYQPNITNGTLTVTAAVLTIKANDAARTYGAANPVLTGAVSGAVNGDSFTSAYTTAATAASPIGPYPITPSVTGPNLGNYTQAVTNGTLTITAANLAVAADNATRAYGLPNPSFSGSVQGAVNGDVIGETFSTSATPQSPTGSYPIVPSATGAMLADYTIASKNGTLTITQAALHLTADNAVRTYGAANPSFTGTITGVVAGDLILEQFSTAATSGSAPGSYPIVPSAQGPALANYAASVTNGTLTVTPAPLVASVQNASRTYGSANPAFSGAVTGALNGESFAESFTTAAAAHSPVGVYPVVPAVTGPTLAFYTATLLPGTLTVTPAPLTVAVSSATRPYGAPNPVFTGSLSGLVQGDAVQASFSAPATLVDAPGHYPIFTELTGSAVANYSVAPATGVLTVVRAGTTTTSSISADHATGRVGFQVQVHSITSGTPTGTVRFFSGKHEIGEATLQNGTAAFQVLRLPQGSLNAVEAVYQGDINFLPSSADPLPVQIHSSSFWVSNGSGAATAQVQAGEKAGLPLQVGPGDGGLYPGVVTFSVSGLPAGATASFSPATLAADSGAQAVMLTIQTVATPAATTARNRPQGSVFPGIAEASLALLLLPFTRARRLRASGRKLTVAILLLASSLFGSGALTGCGFASGSSWSSGDIKVPEQSTSYTLVVTVTSGAVSESTTASLTVLS